MTTKAKKKTRKDVKIFESSEKLNKFAAAKIITVAKQSIKKNDRFTIALAGGNTPKPLYELFTKDEFKSQIEWEKVFFFLGDERDVSPMSEMSNYKMINEILLKSLELPAQNIFRWHTEIINAPEVAESYHKTISRFFGLSNGEYPRFDMVLLGMGDDGHTASLFPFTDALTNNSKIAVSNYVEKFDEKRLTFTFPTINNALNVMFLVRGENKADALKEVLDGEQNHEKFPAQTVKPTKGKLLWVVNKAAAELL